MDNNYTHIVLVADRSGSMQATRVESEGGINALIEDQEKVGGKCTLSLYQFDNIVEKVYDCIDLALLNQKYQLIPRGFTSLYDAIGMAINETKAYIDLLSEELKPATVIICVVTDGFENSSREFNLEQVKVLIEECKARKWDVSFLGSDLKTEEQGKAMGLDDDCIVAFASNQTSSLYNTVSSKMSSYRSMKMAGIDASMTYNSEEKENLKGGSDE